MDKLFLILIFCLLGGAFCEKASWPTLQQGSSGDNVVSLQYLLLHYGYSISVDGQFGPATETATRSFQSSRGLPVTGIVDSRTWPVLCVLLRNGANSRAVTGLQVQLNKHGFNVAEDGVFGSGTESAVRSLQSRYGLAVDGIAGNDTWREALGNGPSSGSTTVGQALYLTCSTSYVNKLSIQLVNSVNKCLHPGLLVDFSYVPRITKGSAVFPYMQKNAADALNRAMTATTRQMTMNSAYRSLAQQLMLYQWYLMDMCGIGLAAKPGTSNHESGLAFDCDDGQSWSSHMAGYSFRWYGSGDPPHYDYIGSGTINLGPSSIKAFQMLWNTNNPNDQIAVDGVYGPDTEKRLLASPVDGFPKEVVCSEE